MYHHISIYFVVVDELVVCTDFQVPPTLRFIVFDVYQVPPELIFSDGLVVVVYPLVEDVSVPLVVPVTFEFTGEEEDVHPLVQSLVHIPAHDP